MNIRSMLLAGLMAGVFVTGCANTERDARKQVVEYFHGSGGAGGKMVRSWKGEKRRDYITAKRAICHLDGSWKFYDESLDIVDLGDYEYFARYSVMFQKEEVIFERTETSYFCGDTSWDAVPLTVEHTKTDLSSESGEQLEYETLWNGDFDAFDERYRTHSKKSISPH